MGRPDPKVTGVAGLVGFGAFLRTLGVDGALHEKLDRLKSDRRVVYPMAAQARLLMDVFAVGETRVFGVEGLASDPLFVHLSGGVVPSLDTLYDDIERFDDGAVGAVEQMAAEHGLWRAKELRGPFVHLDVDTTVLTLSGQDIQGGVLGPNRHYPGRPSYHPMLARLAETGTLVGGCLRPGDTGFGAADIPAVRRWVARAKQALRRGTSLCVRMDSAGDCAELLRALHQGQVFYVIKGRSIDDMCGALQQVTKWRTVERDVDERPSRQVVELDFQRDTWKKLDVAPRVIVVRSTTRRGKQLSWLDDADWAYQVFLTNRTDDADDIAWDYDKRAGIEPLIAELKGAWGIGHVSSRSFAANHAMLLLKMLVYNLLDRYAHHFPDLPRWRTPWRRRTLLRIPGRLSYSGHQHRLHLPPGSPLVSAVLLE